MSSTFYDSQGKPIAYTEDDIHIYLFSGKAVAYLDGSSVYAYNGKHLGRFEDGWIRDNQGHCVFFTQEVSGGPMKPIKKIKPMKRMKKMKPMKRMKKMKPMRPMNRRAWSDLSGEHFFDV